MAEAMFGIDPRLIDKAKRKLPKEFICILERAYKIKERQDDDLER